VATLHFVDSSALVKRYVRELGTSWVRGITRSNPSAVIYVVHITAVEVKCAIARRRKGQTLTARQASSILHRFRKHLGGRYTVLEVTPTLLDTAARLGNRHALRAYDAIQLAAALEVSSSHQAGGTGTVRLISADQDLNQAASAEGLPVDDPCLHP
jgi:predicted nucleic acid-binding protein